MKYILVGERYREKLEYPLKKHGFIPFWLPENHNIANNLAYHCDLSVFSYKNKLILASHLSKHRELVKLLTSRGYEVIISDVKQGKTYPNDINLCALNIGNKIIHNINYTDPEIIKLGLEHINVKQGYSKCSCLAIDDSHIITSDKGVINALKATNIDVLEISDLGIILEGYDKGFIGGASFVSESTVYFTGDILKHPDANIIIDYIISCRLRYCCLTEEAIFDIGGAVVID